MEEQEERERHAIRGANLKRYKNSYSRKSDHQPIDAFKCIQCMFHSGSLSHKTHMYESKIIFKNV